MTTVVVAVALHPEAGRSWGTLTGGANLSAKERADLDKLLVDYGVPPLMTGAELEARLGAHPIHQFIVYEAWLLLAHDPAMRDGGMPFPSVEAINGWDGVDRCEQGIRQRGGTGLVPGLDALVPPDTSGPGADAELGMSDSGTLQWNSRYNVRAHYWNPWLDSGEAPSAAASNFSKLVARLVVGRGNAAHVASYLAHYVSDALSRKHADALMLEPKDVAALDEIGKRWMAARTDLSAWLASPILQEAVRVIEARARAKGPIGQSWLDRVGRHIPFAGGSTILARKKSFLLDIAPSTLTTAVACYLHDLLARPEKKSIDQFYTYFDPFYFNGPVYQPLLGEPSFVLCSPLSEHMDWETNPAQAALVSSTLGAQAGVPLAARTPLLGGPVRSHYASWAPVAGFYDIDGVTLQRTFRETLSNTIVDCARRVHGDIDATSDFSEDFRPPLDTAIECVFTAFRASVTALRGEGWARRVGEGEDREVVIQLRLRNLADREARLIRARVAYDDEATLKRVTRPGWEAALSQRVGPDGGESVDVELRVAGIPKDIAIEDLYVEVRGEIAETPDRGWVRVRLSRQEKRIVKNPEPGTISVGEGAPTDIIVVFDTTSSMQSSLDDMARNTVESIEALSKQTSDLRLAVVTFRDLEVEGEEGHFQVRPFTRDVRSQLAYLTSLRAGGGGDTPEDQLEGISRGIALWEAEGATEARVPAKIIIVVTDAAGKSPDTRGNTRASIARRAREVDPAHIYPIIVGRDEAAMQFAEGLAADTGGKVLRAASGAEVAAVLASAAGTAIEAHAGEARVGKATAWWLIVPGIAVCLVGGLLLIVARGRDRRARREAADG